ncbi:MAG TPA: MBL fold metallo-hydrolase [Vicinamibacteria bacterium]|jgi:flavorubredoxin
MTVTNVHEIAEDLYRISTPIPEEAMPGGFTFNQFLLVDEEPLLFHTGPRRLFTSTRDAVREVIAPSKLRWIAFSHVEADECGPLNEWLAEAPAANPLCSRTAAMVSIGDLADREPRGLGDGERVSLGRHTLTWIDTPHLPHGWECGYLFDERTRTLLCGDLFTQGGNRLPAVTESDSAIWESSEAARKAFSYYADLRNPMSVIEKLAATEPEVLACMHGSSYRGKGAPLLRRLGEALSRS